MSISHEHKGHQTQQTHKFLNAFVKMFGYDYCFAFKKIILEPPKFKYTLRFKSI